MNDIKDSLISYETAVLAKEKGFGKTLETIYPHSYKEEDNSKLCINSSNNTEKGFIAVSRQSELQKWLREKKQLYIDIGTGYNPKTKNVGYSIEILIPSKEDVWMEMLYSSDNSAYNTYELALEDALQRSLNSIII